MTGNGKSLCSTHSQSESLGVMKFSIPSDLELHHVKAVVFDRTTTIHLEGIEHLVPPKTPHKILPADFYVNASC